MRKPETELRIDGRRIAVSNLNQIIYPGHRFTKAKVLDYYIKVSEFLLPHLKNRPVTLKRFPDGVYGEAFYEKDAPGFAPEWVRTFPVPRRSSNQPDIRYILINDLATLAWVINFSTIELHSFLHQVPKLEQPNYIVFDCDPGAGANLLTCCEAALMLRDVLVELNLESFAKVSGSKGLQVYVPLNTTGSSYELTQPFAKAVAQLLAERAPKLIVAEMPKVFRARNVFIDWSQNTGYKTTACVYSLRAKTYKPFVSFPVEWDELKAAKEKDDENRLLFEPKDALLRLNSGGDQFAIVLKKRQKLPGDFVNYLSRPTVPESLATYREKRDFKKTAEPAPQAVSRSRQGSRRRFVIQKHAAGHLHYDFRLEMHGVLKSWAVPKGPPFKEGDKRLAMSTEDHPIEYLEFEGIIPRGQYGGGTVMVWDIGTYEIIEGNYYRGYLRVFLNGVKLKGEWELRRFEQDKRNGWQLAKVSGNTRAVSKKRDDSSAVSGRAMAEIAAARDAVWQSNRS